jgi:hypothetical protein
LVHGADVLAGALYTVTILPRGSFTSGSVTSSGANEQSLVIPEQDVTGLWSYTGEASASAGPGGLRGKVEVSGSAAHGNSVGLTMRTFSTVRIDDVIITDPSGEATTVMTSLNLALGGIFAGNVPERPTAEHASSALHDIVVTARVNNVASTGSASLDASWAVGRFPNPGAQVIKEVTGPLFTTNLFQAPILPDNYSAQLEAGLTTPLVSVPVGTPFTIEFTLQTGAGAGGVGGLSSGSTDFYSTLWFDPSRPIFNLPPGWDAESSLFQNNGIPEPTSLTLTVFAFLVVSRWRVDGVRVPRAGLRY